jgi:hypothetical protein
LWSFTKLTVHILETSIDGLAQVSDTKPGRLEDPYLEVSISVLSNHITSFLSPVATITNNILAIMHATNMDVDILGCRLQVQ